MPEQPTDKEMIEAARQQYLIYEDINVDDTIGDPGCMVSRNYGKEAGAYVRAWVWVYFNNVPGYEDYYDEEPTHDPTTQ